VFKIALQVRDLV